jgi:AcrR family transcriptional regulator
LSDRKTEILEAACRVIARSGMHDLRVEDVAKEANVSPALVYYYFTTRAELLAQAFSFADVRSFQHTMAKLQPTSSVAEQLRNLLLAELDEGEPVRANWAIWREMEANAPYDASLAEAVNKNWNEWVDSIADLIRQGQEEGSIPPGRDPALAAERLTAVVNNAGSRAVLGAISADTARRIVESAVDLEIGVVQPA